VVSTERWPASAAQIMRGEIYKASELYFFTYDPPDSFLAEAVAPDRYC
jgi:hypothetical protein